MLIRKNKYRDEYLFCSIPSLDIAQVVIRTSRKLKAEVKAEQPIYVLHEIEQPADLIFNLHDLSSKFLLKSGGAHLRGHAEYVRIVLYESPNSRQPRQRTRRLIPVDNAEFCHADGQLLVTPVARVEDQAMAWAVHGLQCPLLLLDVQCEHVVLVVLPVSGSLPDLGV